MNSAQRHQFACETFDAIRPPGWGRAPSGMQVPQGADAPVCAVTHEDGRQGVFRCLKTTDETRVARFHRELRILTEKISHRNVVPLLERTQRDDEHWYISERGDPFRHTWELQRSTFSSAELLQRAIDLGREVCNGLATCHAQGIVHRDVKPGNIVMKRGVVDAWPMLIDFGIAFEPEGERLTPEEDHAVGNRRYSPDLMRWRTDDVPPWIDVFELAQVLLWMLEIRPPKHYWERPVHWKHVRLIDGLSESDERSVLALAALCSNQDVSPKNGSELLALLDTLFPSVNGQQKTSDVNIATIADNLRIGKAQSLLERAENQERHDSCRPMAVTVYTHLRSVVDPLVRQLSSAYPVRIVFDADLANENLLAAKEGVHWSRKTLYDLRLGGGTQEWIFKIVCQAIPPFAIAGEDGKLPRWRRLIPQHANLFTFIIDRQSRYSVEKADLIIILPDGSLLRRLISGHNNIQTFGDAQPITYEDLNALITAKLTDAKLWQSVGRV